MSEAAFLSAIAAEPANDTVRLVFADWLEERGDPAGVARAEFIRLGCELAGRPAADPRRREMEAASDSLQAEFAATWFAPLIQLGAAAVTCDRGVPTQVSIPMHALLANGTALFEQHPTLTGVQITQVDPRRAAALAAQQFLARLTRLDLSRQPISAPAVLTSLVNSPHLSNLEHLVLNRVPMGPAGAQAIADSRSLPRLKHLDLLATRVGDQGAAAIAGSSHLNGLEHLDLGMNQVTDAGVAALAGRRWGRLKLLDLKANPITDAGAAALAAADGFVDLTSLDLSYTNVSRTGADAIARAPRRRGLTHFVPPGDASYDEMNNLIQGPMEPIQRSGRGR